MSEYLRNAQQLYDEGKISQEVFHAILLNAEAFCDE